MPDFVVRNKNTGKFLHRGGDYSTPPERWKADTVSKARIYRTRGAVTNSIGKYYHVEPEYKIRRTCNRCGDSMFNKRREFVGRYCPNCGQDNRYQINDSRKRYVPDWIEVLELEVTLKEVDILAEGGVID